jgi:hypothetical protein
MRKRARSRNRGQALAQNLPDGLTTGIRLLLWERKERINARLNSVILVVCQLTLFELCRHLSKGNAVFQRFTPCHYISNYSNLRSPASRFISWVCAPGIVRFYAALRFIFSSVHSRPLPPLLPGLARMRNLAAAVSSSSCLRSIATTIFVTVAPR